MSTVDSALVRSFMNQTALDEESEQAFQEIHSSIAQDSGVLMGLIMNLESFLTSSDDKDRNRATLLLAKLLEAQHKPLTASQIHHFCVFFNSRVADYPSLSPCLRALKGIVEHQWEHFDEKYQDVSDIFDTIFKELEVQDLPQSIRSRVFALLLALLSCSMVLAAVQPLAQRVVQGVLDAVEGEKDPRCLVQCFRLVALLFTAFPPALLLDQSSPRPRLAASGGKDHDHDHNDHDDHDHDHNGQCCSSPPTLSHGERIFNIMACYFPITFSPPPGDPHGITAPMLTQSLKHALCDDSHVSSFVIPFLMDQLLAPPESVCRSHAVFYLHFLVQRHANSKRSASQPALPTPLLLVLGQLSEALYDIALEDTTALPLFSLPSPSQDTDESDEASVETSPGRTLTDQAIDLIALVSKQIGTSAQHGDALWMQFGEPMVFEIVKNTRKSVQNMTTKANIKVALAMASSTFKITSTLIDRLVPVLLGHVNPVLTRDMDLMSAAAGATQPQKLLQHDLERKQHDKNSAAVGLMYLAQLLSSTLTFDLNFSQYSRVAVNTQSGIAEPTKQVFDGLLQLLCQYSLDFFQFGNCDKSAVDVNRGSVGLYAGCLRCIQTLVAMRLQNKSDINAGAGADGDVTDVDGSVEGQLLHQVTVNCCSEGDTSSNYDWAADVRQASVLYVSQCRNMYLSADSHLAEHNPDSAERSGREALFEKSCIDVLSREITSEPSAQRLNHVFHTISYLLQPFSAAAGARGGSGDAVSWNVLDDKLLSILLTCITTSTESGGLPGGSEGAGGVQKFALAALIDCLPTSASVVTENHIVTSLVTPVQSSGGDVTNLQKLIHFSIGPSCDEESLALVCQIVHLVLAALSARSAPVGDDVSTPVVDAAIKSCIQAILLGCAAPTALIFAQPSASSDHSPAHASPGSNNQAARVLLCLLNVLNKECWVWKYINSIGADGADSDESVVLWSQLVNVLFSNVVLRESGGAEGVDAVFTDTCTRLLAVILNKSAAGKNFDALLTALDTLITTCTATSAALPLSAQESVVLVLVLTVRALSMRRPIAITIIKQPATGPASKTWQDRFLHILMDLILQSSESTGVAQTVTLALIGKHIHHLSCDHKDQLLSSGSSNCTSMMWRQKLWHKCLPVLTTAVQQASAQCVTDDDSVQQPIAALLCLCSLASEMPLQVVHEHLPQLIAFSVQALMVNDPSTGVSSTHGEGDDEDRRLLLEHVRRYLRHAAAQCLLSSCQSTLPAIIEALSPHLSTLVPLLVQGAQADSGTTLAATRASCVQCLYFLAGGDMCRRFQYHSLHPLKRLVVRGLAVVLGDKKQSVRRWAAKVRNLWISLQD